MIEKIEKKDDKLYVYHKDLSGYFYVFNINEFNGVSSDRDNNDVLDENLILKRIGEIDVYNQELFNKQLIGNSLKNFYFERLNECLNQSNEE